jgi:hypothetical protein
MQQRFGEQLGRSTVAEPNGIINSLCHLLNPSASGGPRDILLATDSTVSQASYNRGFNTHSFVINECLRRAYNYFNSPDDARPYKFRFIHVQGEANLADGLSRGRGVDEVDRAKVTGALLGLMGTQRDLPLAPTNLDVSGV